MNKILPLAERFLVIALIIGFLLKISGNDAPFLINISLAGLGIVFFLNIYLPIHSKAEENEQPDENKLNGLNELLSKYIVPKVIWIGSAVATVGLLLYNLQLGNNGYLRLLYMGGSTIVIAVVVMLILRIIGTKYTEASTPALIRALPTLMIVGYIVFA